jgi:hypothetical protein
VTEDRLRLMALELCMRTGYRYLECLWCVVVYQDEQYTAAHDEPEWFDAFWKQVQREFSAYRKAMQLAGLPWFDLSFRQPKDVRPKDA